MLFGLTRGEIVLIAFVFALVYGAGLLPKLISLLSGESRAPEAPEEAAPEKD